MKARAQSSSYIAPLIALLFAAEPALGAGLGVSSDSSAQWEASSHLPKTQESALPGDPLQVTVHRLKNGLTVYLSPNHEVPRITAWISVRAGSRHDPADSTGMAHYLEHMFFKGSRSLGTVDFNEEKAHLDAIDRLYEDHFVSTDTAERKAIYGRIDQENIQASRYAVPNELDKLYKRLGFEGVNAYTSDEQTVFIADLPKNRLETWARLESDRFSAPVFRLFQTELETVYEEKNRAMDNPDRILYDTMQQTAYGSHPYSRSVLGSMEHLRNPSLKKMYEFRARWYVPNNMAICMAGDFEPKAVLALLERYFGAWTPRPLESIPAYELPKPSSAVHAEVRYEAEEEAVLMWLLPPYGHPDHDAITVMDMVMDNSESGIVNLTLNQAQKVKRAGSSPEFMNEGGAWVLWAVPKDGQTLEEAEALLLGAVDRLKAGEFSDEDLRSVVTSFEIQEKQKLESNGERTAAMVNAFTHHEEWADCAKLIERLRKVSKEDVLRVARRYLGEGRASVYRRRGKPAIPSIEKPGFTKLELDRERGSAFYRELLSMPAEPIEPRWLKEGRDYLKRGIAAGELLTVKNPFNDLFSVEFHFDRGRKQERELCAAMDLFELSGAGDLSAEQLKKKLYALGTTMSASCSESESSVSIFGLDRNLEESLRLLRLRFESPNIASDTLKKMIEVQIGAHKDNKVQPGYLVYALSEWSKRGEQSAVLGEMNDGELRSLDEGRLKGVLEKTFGYAHRTAYVGNRPTKEIAKLLYMGKSSIQKVPTPPAVRWRHPASDEVLFTHRDMLQSQIGFFAPEGDYDPEKAVDYEYYSEYVGGGMSAVIFQEIRESRALAYSAKGGFDSADRKEDENALWARLGTQADKTIEASAVLRGIFEHLPSSESRFLETKKGIEESYRTSPVAFREVPDTIFNWEDMGFPGDPRPHRFMRALSYTLKDLEGFAQRFQGQPKTLYILGNRSRLDLEGLKRFGTVAEVPVDKLFPY
jgi:predicted Zn-dependent peptidase